MYCMFWHAFLFSTVVKSGINIALLSTWTSLAILLWPLFNNALINSCVFCLSPALTLVTVLYKMTRTTAHSQSLWSHFPLMVIFNAYINLFSWPVSAQLYALYRRRKLYQYVSVLKTTGSNPSIFSTWCVHIFFVRIYILNPS